MIDIYSSREAILLILAHEQLRLKKYDDGFGNMTIGWGHKIEAGENIPDTIDRVSANDLFLNDMLKREIAIYKALGSKADMLSKNQFGACMSLVFNIGVSAFINQSSVFRDIITWNLDAVPGHFKLWNKATDKRTGAKYVVPELVLRRNEEVRIWLRG